MLNYNLERSRHVLLVLMGKFVSSAGENSVFASIDVMEHLFQVESFFGFHMSFEKGRGGI